MYANGGNNAYGNMYSGSGQQQQGQADGFGQNNAMMPSVMQGGGGMPGAMGSGGMGGDGQQAAGMYGQQQQQTPQAMAQMQAMYQQYALRWAAMQRFAAQQQAAQQGGMGGGGGMGQNFGGGGGMGMGPGGGMGRGNQGGGGGRGFGGGMGGGMGQNFGGGMGGGRGGGMGGGGGGGGGDLKRVCNKFRDTGACPYGDSCRFSHGESDMRNLGGGGGGGGGGMVGGGGQGFGGRGGFGPGGGGGMMGGAGRGFGRGISPAADFQEKRAMIDLMKKTRLCDEFMQTGVCKYGDRCTFAHGEHELRTAPDMPAAGRPGQAAQPFVGKDIVRKTRLCERFMTTGMCNYGDKCTFAHGHHELKQRSGPAPPAAAAKPAAAAMPGVVVAPAVRLLDSAGQSVEPAPVQDQSQGQKRRLEIEPAAAPAAAAPAADVASAPSKRAHVEPEVEPVPDCPLCAQLVAMGKPKLLEAVQALENPKAKQIGCMIMAASPQLGQLWHRCTAATVMGWVGRASLSLTDKIELLKSVVFHVHPPASATAAADGAAPMVEGDDAAAAAAPKAGIEAAQKYVDQGLPPHVADFVHVCMEGQEGSASMSEYFHLLEVVKAQFSIDDEVYYTVSSATATICMGM